MRFVRLLVILATCLAGFVSVRAAGPADQYIPIYSLIQEADALSEREQTAQAMAKYMEAHSALQRFQRGYPEWGADVVKFRLGYVASRIEALSKKPAPEPVQPAQAVEKPAPAEKASASAEQLARLNDQIRQLVGDKALLEAKLKEALSAQPASVDPRELAKAEEKIKALQKANELLNASLAQEKEKPANNVDAGALSKAQQSLIEANRQLSQEREASAKLRLEKEALLARVKPQTAEPDAASALRARLAVLEAQAVPYTPEELALFKQPPARLAGAAAPVAAKTTRPLSASAVKLVAEARRDFASRQLDKAEKKFAQVLKEDPNNSMALTDLAVIQMEMKRLDEAEKNIRQAVTATPDNAYAYSTLGRLLFIQGKYDEAVEALGRAAQLDPKSAEIQNRLGIALSQKGLRAPAETALRKALVLDPSYAEAHQNLAVVYLSQQPAMVELARWHYQKALATGAPKNADLEKMIDQRKVASQ